jgi:hypothetical protein
MRAIRECTARPLQWRGGPLHSYLLQAAGETLAVLRLQQSAEVRALVETAEGELSFERRGSWQPQIVVRRCPGGAELAVFEPALWQRDGLLIDLQGPLYRWHYCQVPGTRRAWQELTDRPLLQFAPPVFDAQLGLSGLMSVEPPALKLTALPLLATLGWYLLLLDEGSASSQPGADLRPLEDCR